FPKELRFIFFGNDLSKFTETPFMSLSDMRCDIWIQISLAEFGLKLKTECNIQKNANPQILKYASSREPCEMVLMNKKQPQLPFQLTLIRLDGISIHIRHSQYYLWGDLIKI
ncbi:hypothetical protein BC833DRAFT_568944, partial [Globomyces pollinis-pini]